MKIPYSSLELRIALLGLLGPNQEKISEGKGKELEAEFAERVPKDKKEMNKKVAESNGISVSELIKSPNYKILCDEYKDDITNELVCRMTEKFEITEKQAWALVAHVLGFLD